MKKGFITVTGMAFLLFLVMFTTTKAWAYRGSLTGDGSNVNPYYIMDLEDWAAFTSLLNDPAYAPYYADKHFRLGADIGDPYDNSDQKATTWAANLKDYPFTGSFDGQGHTIYIDFTQVPDNINRDDYSQGVALFHFVSNGCDIHDLTVHGKIRSDYKYAAGVISCIRGGSPQGVHFVNVSRCTSEVQFALGITGDATSGGLVAFSDDYVCLTVNDCLFRGSYISATATHCSGIVGYQSPDGFVRIENCFVNPYSVTIPYDENNHNLCRCNYYESYDFSNCYYSTSFGDKQGEYVSPITNPEWLAAKLGYWTVVNGQPVPLTINLMADYCTLFSGFSAYDYWTPYNTNTYFGDEGYAKLVDDDRQTKWCVSYPYSMHNEWEPIDVKFDCERRFVPKGYIITTGNDTKNHTDRRPKEWQILGYNETTGYWDVLDHRVATDVSNRLPEANMADKAFLMSNYANITTDYKRFEFKVIDIWREDEYWDGFLHGWKTNTDDFVCEVGELQLFGVMSDADLHDLSNCAISGMLPYYDYTGSEIPLHYIVTDYHNNELVEYTHYTKNIVWKYGTQTADHVSNVTEPGEYTITINGMNGYTGSKSYSFVVMSSELPTPMAWTNDNGSAFYYVKMPQTGMTTMDLSETDPDFTHQFYVFSDNGYNQGYSPYCNGQLHIKAPDGYVLQLQGRISCYGYPDDYLVIYDGADMNSPVLGDDHYGVRYDENIPLLYTTGQDLLLYFKSNGAITSLTGVNLTVTPVSAAHGYDINIADVDHGELTAPQTTDIAVCSEVTLNVVPDDGYMLQDVAVTITEGAAVNSDKGLWYTGKNTVVFNMPASDVNVTPTFATKNDLSINMPANSCDIEHAKNAYIPADVTTFKVYDDGGETGVCTSNSSGLLILNSPANTILEFSGNVNLYDDGSYLEIYNGDSFNNPIGWYYNNSFIDKELSVGNKVMLLFVTGMNGAPGFDLTVRVIDKNDEFNIGINNVTGGTVAVHGEAKAHVYDTVTLDVAVENSYLVTQYTMSPDCHQPVSGGVWHESPTEATFVMPAEDIEIIPTITNDLSADGGLYINMPESNKYDYKVVEIPSGVSSFKVYDDGGRDGDYSMFCDGYLVLTAPVGYRLKLSGNVTCNDKGTPHDYLKVYDGDDVTAAPLGNPDGFGYQAGLDFGPLTSSGRSMLLNFYTSSNNMSGLDLTVEISNEAFPYIIEFDDSQVPQDCSIVISGYESVSNNHYVAHVGNTITLTVAHDDNHLLTAFSLKDADGNDIPLSDGICWFDGNNSNATFTMPARNLIITYDFAEKGDQYITLPKQNGIQTLFEVTPPDGITSFKIYDDGGLNGNYSDNCDSYTLLTAPAGKAWQLTGTVTMEDGNDFIIPYDGNSMTTRIDGCSYGKSSGQDIGTLVTITNQVLVVYNSNYAINYSGVNLTATIVDPIARSVDGYANVAPGQDRWTFIAAPLKNGRTPYYVENLFPVGEYGEPLVTSAEYDLYRFNQSADAEWENYKMHSGNFTIYGGNGYLYATKYARTLYFGGSVTADNSVEVPLVYDANARLAGWNLVGNPLWAPAYPDRPYYAMSELGNDIEPVDDYTRWPIPMCTGVIVCADGGGESVTFSKTAPVSRSEARGSIKMTLSKDGTRGADYQDRAIVSFDEGIKLAKFIFNEDNAKLYIPRDGNDYAIAGVEHGGETPLFFKTKKTGRYTITFETNDATLLKGVQLVDKFEDVVVNLSACNSYTFMGSAADSPNRFRLVFAEESVIDNFAYQNGSDIIVEGEGELQIFDVMGREAGTMHVNGVQTISASSLPTGVCIFRLNEKVQKIVIR